MYGQMNKVVLEYSIMLEYRNIGYTMHHILNLNIITKTKIVLFLIECLVIYCMCLSCTCTLKPVYSSGKETPSPPFVISPFCQSLCISTLENRSKLWQHLQQFIACVEYARYSDYSPLTWVLRGYAMYVIWSEL